MNMTRNLKKISILTAVMLILSLVIAGCFTVPGASIANADCSVGAYPASSFGGVETGSLWYYGADFLNLAALKSEVASWDLAKAAAVKCDEDGYDKTDATKPIIIAVVDTGINTSHGVFTSTNTILKNSSGTPYGYNSYNAVNSGENLGSVADVSSNSHGTGIASAMAMLIYELGLSDYIKIYPVKASYTKTSGGTKVESFGMSAVTEAISWADESVDVDVINLSLGLLASDFLTTADKWDSNPELIGAITKATNDTVLVAAAGNNSKNSSVDAFYPASTRGVLSVMAYAYEHGAVIKRDTSNYGGYDVIAPGENIYVAKGSTSEYTYMNGTSIAAAFVSVTAALVRLKSIIDCYDSTKTPFAGGAIERHIRLQGDREGARYVSHTVLTTTYVYPMHSILECVNTVGNTAYRDPTGIEMTSSGLSEDGQIINIDKVVPMQFSAQLLPYGDVDPALLSGVEWWLVEIGERIKTDTSGAVVTDNDGNPVTEEYEKSESFLSSGGTLNFTPTIGGKFKIRAKYRFEDTVYSDEAGFTIRYLTYDSMASGVKVVLESELKSQTPTNNIKIYANDSVTLALSNLEYVDKSVGIKWFVNGEYVFSGEAFTFTPDTKGTFVISAQYGDKPAVRTVFTVNAESSALRPQSIAAYTIMGAIILSVGIAAITISAKKALLKKKPQTEDEKTA